MKIVVCGDIDVTLIDFFKRLITKLGSLAFELSGVFCVGEFGNLRCDGMIEFVRRRSLVPFPTYFLTKHNFPQIGLCICPNLMSLGKIGKFETSEGVLIVYCYEDSFNRYDDENERLKMIDELVGPSTAVDVLLTNIPPSGFEKYENPNEQLSRFISQMPAKSVLSARIAKILCPRYHFSSGVDFYERTPYLNVTGKRSELCPLTRLVVLANAKFNEGLFAVEIEGLSSRPFEFDRLPTIEYTMCPY